MEQETISKSLNRVTEEIGKLKTIEALEGYIQSLPPFLVSNGLLRNLFEKRRKHLTK